MVAVVRLVRLVRDMSSMWMRAVGYFLSHAVNRGQTQFFSPMQGVTLGVNCAAGTCMPYDDEPSWHLTHAIK